MGFPIRFAHWIASTKPKILRPRLEFLGRQVLTGGFASTPKIKTTRPKRAGLFLWRRWWDSNPRARLRTKRFRVVLVTTTSIHLRILFNKHCKRIEVVVCAWRSRAFDFGAKAPLRYISVLMFSRYNNTILPQGQGFMRKNSSFLY